MSPPNEFVAILVLNRNNRDDTLRCLESVFRLDYSPFEVVLIDNGSTDRSWEAVGESFPQVHLVRSETNLGVAGGRNLCLYVATQAFPTAHFLLPRQRRVGRARFAPFVGPCHAGRPSGRAHHRENVSARLASGVRLCGRSPHQLVHR